MTQSQAVIMNVDISLPPQKQERQRKGETGRKEEHFVNLVTVIRGKMRRKII
jgi:hypothetical protein